MRLFLLFLMVCSLGVAKPYSAWSLGYVAEVGFDGLPTSEMLSIATAMGHIKSDALGYELGLKLQYAPSVQMLQALASAHILSSLEWPMFDIDSVARLGVITGAQSFANSSGALAGIDFGFDLYFDRDAQEQWYISYSMGGMSNWREQLELFYGFSIGMRYF